MAIKTMKATVNGQTYDLTLNESTGKYEAVLTAPSGSSFNLSGGYYPVSVTATDTAGNSTTVDSTHATLGSSLRLFVKENYIPKIRILEPNGGSYVTNSKPTIRFEIVDNENGQTTGYSGINKGETVLKINGTAVSGITWETITGGYRGTYTPASDLSDGNCTITVDGKDNDGNSAATASCSFKIDTLAPSLTVNSPTEGLETNQSSVTVSGRTDDVTSKPVTVRITLNGTDQGSVTVGSDGSFSKDITLSQQGENTIVIKATDSAGKETTVRRTVIYSTTAPVIKSVLITPNPVTGGGVYTITVEVE